MASKLRAALAALQSQIALADGTGAYTYDLSGTDSVLYGLHWPPPKVPGVMIADVALSDIEVGNTMEAMTHTWTVQVIGYVDGASDDYLTRKQNAADLLNDIMLALFSDRTMGGNTRDLYASSAQVAGTLDGVAPAYGFCTLDVVLEIKNGVGA